MMSQFNNTKSKSLQEWVDMYERKTGEKVILPPGFVMYWLPKRGFAQFKVDKEGSILMIHMVCGDIHYWHDTALLMCMQNDIDHISTVCTRDVYAYMRMFGWNVVEEFDKDGDKRFICRDEAGCKVIITQRTRADDGKSHTYWVTHYLKERL